MCVSSGVIDMINRGKKRPVNVNNWKCNARKRARDMGQAYISSRNREMDSLSEPKGVRGITLYILYQFFGAYSSFIIQIMLLLNYDFLHINKLSLIEF